MTDTATIEELNRKLDLILDRLEPKAQTTPRKSFTIAEATKLMGRSPTTLREWAQLGRINASKRHQKRGGVEIWSVSADEVQRYLNEGLLPIDPARNADRWEVLTDARGKR